MYREILRLRIYLEVKTASMSMSLSHEGEMKMTMYINIKNNIDSSFFEICSIILEILGYCENIYTIKII